MSGEKPIHEDTNQDRSNDVNQSLDERVTQHIINAARQREYEADFFEEAEAALRSDGKTPRKGPKIRKQGKVGQQGAVGRSREQDSFNIDPSLGTTRLTAFFDTLQVELSDAKKANEFVTFAIERQRDRARKKAVFPGRSKELEDVAVDRFKSINQNVSEISINLSRDIVSNSRHFIRCVLENYTTMVRDYCVQVDLDPLHLFDLWSFGPGASIGTKSTHPVEKMYGPWSCTPSALSQVLQLRRNHPYLYLHDRGRGDISCSLVPGSKLATVPKNEERNRTIAIEPLGNMCLQLAAGKYLEGALRRIGLDIRDQQPKNKEAARRGSLDGSLSTIDLKDASDMFSPDLVRLLLPEDWYELLMKIRSPSTILPDGSELKLNMISTMGNGFTFPLMTLILLSLIYAVMCEHNRTRSLFINWDEVYVFGDDLIIPSDLFEPVCNCIEQAGLIVNRDKSFFQGPFRESCGGDYYKGYDVTPFYVRALTSNSEVYVALNQVLEWSARHKISLPKTLDFLIGCVDGPVLLVPEWSNPDSGIRTSLVSGRYKQLSPQPVYKQCVNSTLAMPLAVGGYLTTRPDSPDLFYTPRLYKTRYKVRKMRLPRGFLNGRDPLTRSPQVSHAIDIELIIRGLGQ